MAGIEEPRAATLAAPLATTLALANRLNEHLHVQLGTPGGDGWIAAPELAANSAALEAVMARIGAAYATRDRKILGSFFLGSYAWQVVGTAAAFYLAGRRVPDLAAENLSIRFDDSGRARAVALAGGRFAALPDDPAAGHPGVTLVANGEALRDHLRATLEAHFAPLVEAVWRRSGFSRRALWWSVSDRCASAFIRLTAALGQPELCRCEIEGLVRVPGSPLACGAGAMPVECAGRCELFLKRAACRLHYKCPAGRKCATCPLLPLEERTRLLQEAMLRRG